MLPFRKQILIAEDDPDDRECYLEGFSGLVDIEAIEFVQSGAALLQTLHNLKDNLPSLLVLDNLLPDMSAEKLLSLLKKEESLRQLPVIIISGSCNEAMKTHLLAAGAKNCWEKPASLQEWQTMTAELSQLMSVHSPQDIRRSGEAA